MQAAPSSHGGLEPEEPPQNWPILILAYAAGLAMWGAYAVIAGYFIIRFLGD